MSVFSPTLVRHQRQRQDLVTISANERWINDISAKELYEQTLLGAIRSGTDPNAPEEIEVYEGYEPPVYNEVAARHYALQYEEKRRRIARERREMISALRSSGEHLALSPFEQLLVETEYYTGVRVWHGGHPAGHPSRGHSRPHASQEDKGETSEGLEMLHITDTPSYIRGKLRPYQIEGVNWLLGLFSRCVNGILADEMGLGKTFQTIAAIAYLKFTVGMPGPHIVVCPKSVLGNWFREFKRWCPALSVYKFHCSSDVRTSIVKAHLHPVENLRYDVVVTTFEMVLEEITMLRRIAFKYLIVDEAHKLKNEDSRAHLALNSLNAAQRLIITGTPLQNNLKELWALLHFLAPQLFEESSSFEGWFDTASGQQDKDVMSNMHKMLAPLMIRRLKADVNTGIPPKKEIYVSCRLTKKQREWYLRILSNDADALNKSKSTSVLTNVMMELRKVINHPYLIDGVEEGPPFLVNESIVKVSGKMQILDKLLHRLHTDVEGHHKVLIFSQFTTMLDILEDYCNMRKYKSHRIDGSTTGYDRESQMATFNSPHSDSFIFLLSTRAGGLGINLQAANHVIIYDSDWNPQMDLQAQDRAHRIGQKRSVRIYRFVTDGTVEEKIYRRALKKLYLDAVVVQQGRVQSKSQQNASKAELLAMIKFGAEEIFKSRHEDITEGDIDHLLDEGEARSAELTSETKKQISMSLASFELGAEEANIYEFEGVSFKSGVESRLLHIRMNKPVAQEALEKECNLYGQTLKVVLHPNLSEALVFFRSVADAMEARTHLPYETAFATRENQAVVSREMISECLGNDEEKLGKGHRHRDKVVMYEEEEEPHRRASAPKWLQIRPAPHFQTHQLYNKKRLFDLHNKEVSLLLLKGEQIQEEAKKLGVDAEELANSKPDLTKVLSDIELEERERLLAEGFPTWTLDEYRILVRALTSGTVSVTDYQALSEVIKTKTPAEIRPYLSAFLERGEQCIKNFDSIERRIKRGQEKLEERESVLRAAKWKVESTSLPESQLSFKCGRMKGCTEAMDRKIFLSGYKSGMNSVEGDIILNAPEFRFNVWCQSRRDNFFRRRLRVLMLAVKREWERTEDDGERNRSKMRME